MNTLPGHHLSNSNPGHHLSNSNPRRDDVSYTSPPYRPFTVPKPALLDPGKNETKTGLVWLWVKITLTYKSSWNSSYTPVWASGTRFRIMYDYLLYCNVYVFLGVTLASVTEFFIFQNKKGLQTKALFL